MFTFYPILQYSAICAYDQVQYNTFNLCHQNVSVSKTLLWRLSSLSWSIILKTCLQTNTLTENTSWTSWFVTYIDIDILTSKNALTYCNVQPNVPNVQMFLKGLCQISWFSYKTLQTVEATNKWVRHSTENVPTPSHVKLYNQLHQKDCISCGYGWFGEMQTASHASCSFWAGGYHHYHNWYFIKFQNSQPMHCAFSGAFPVYVVIFECVVGYHHLQIPSEVKIRTILTPWCTVHQLW